MTSPVTSAAVRTSGHRATTPGTSPANAANATRNAQATQWRTARWRPARTALWRLLDSYVKPGDRVAVVGAGNGHDVPLRRLRRRAGHVDLVDLDAAALRRARRRLVTRRRGLGVVVEDVTFGCADAITRAILSGEAVSPQTRPQPHRISHPYDIVVADLLFTQLLYPALADARIPGPMIDSTLRRHGQPLTDAVVAWLHASAPHGLIVHVHDLLGWWAGHPQPVALDEILTVAEHDLEAALQLAQTGNVPHGCDPRQACLALGAKIIDTALWRWPFAPGVDYLVCATVARAGDPEQGRVHANPLNRDADPS